MAQIANTGAEKAANTAKNATDDVAERSKRIVNPAAAVTREMTDRAEDVARGGLHVVQRTVDAVGEVERTVVERSAEGTAELGQALLNLVQTQTRHNLETWTALTEAVDWDRVAKAVDWDRVLQIQSEYLRLSFERATQLTQRYVEVVQAVTNSAAGAAKRQARKAA